MDWTKAKTILIVALLITNLVLIGTYLFQNNNFKSDQKEIEAVTVKLLEQKDIFVKTDVPKEHPRMAKLTVQYDKLNEDVVRRELAKQKALPDSQLTEKNLIAMTTEFLKSCRLMTENVTYAGADREDGTIKVNYKNCVDGIAVEVSYITFTVKGGKITDFQRYWLNPVEMSDTEKEVIPAAAALIKFMSEKTTDEKIYIKGISLVYWLDSGTFDAESPVTDTAFPAWKITYDQENSNQENTAYIPAWEQ